MRFFNAKRCAASALVAGAIALTAGTSRADDAQQFELLKGLFYAGQYEEVVQRLGILYEPSNPACATVEGAPTVPQTCHLADPVLIERCREMEIVALFGLKRQGEADAVIERILRQNPNYNPDPGSLPASVVERVRDIKGRMQKEIEDEARRKADEQRKAMLAAHKAAEEERKWIAELSALASKEVVIEKRSRLVAFVPFGIGQLQNGDTGLGIMFMATQALAAGTAIGLGTAHAFYSTVDLKAKDPAGRPVNRDEVIMLTHTTAVGNQIAFGTWAALALAGIIQANVAFVPEVRTVKPRELPKRPAPAVLPAVTPSQQGLTVGVVGVF
ncbi:MAG: hypothetical protein R3B70_33370 [Polyangiaceae bacterium]